MQSLFILKLLFACLLLVRTSLQQTLYGYICQVPNCHTCSYQNICGLCSNNYLLQVNPQTSVSYCAPVLCSIPYCVRCYQAQVCAVCDYGYYISPTGLCLPGTAPYNCTNKCLACDSTSCLLCYYGYNLVNGNCFPNLGVMVPNCQSNLGVYSCQLCNPGYIVTPSYQCIPSPNLICNQMQFCVECIENTTSPTNQTCTSCSPGFYINSQGTCSQQTCNVTNCAKCQQLNCTACVSGYGLVTSSSGVTSCLLKVYPCQVSNCVYCKSANICGQCSLGYQVQKLQQAGLVLGTACVLITASAGGRVSVTNCQQYGYMIPGTSKLSIGCIQCQQNFINVAGYCVANLSQAHLPYQCNINNCLYCISPNLCGKCISGYTVYLGFSQCIKNFSPLPNCLLTPLLSFICAQCQPGYALVNNQYCELVGNLSSGCSIVGCNYCVVGGICALCFNGYTLTNGTCIPKCNISNCYECQPNNTCSICSYGYYLSSVGSCLLSSPQPLTYCSLTFTIYCIECNYYQCLQCSNGYAINTQTNQCCPAPSYNYANCASYQTIWSNINCQVNISCLVCQAGALQLPGSGIGSVQCTQIPCNISNCLYCHKSSICIVCSPNYTLISNICTQFTPQLLCPPTCVTCNSTNQCTSCISGYVLYHGTCVCRFQNCLACQGLAYCTVCAEPTVAAPLYDGGCVVQGVLFGQCADQGCLACFGGVCVKCANGFSLYNGSCIQNTCNKISHCMLCPGSQLTCYQCQPNYLLQSPLNQTCIPAPQNYTCQVPHCSICQASQPNTCVVCLPFYALNSSTGLCDIVLCVDNCMFCYNQSSCMVCNLGYYLANGGGCVGAGGGVVDCPGEFGYEDCLACGVQNQTQVVCIQCAPGLQPTIPTITSQQACIPQTCLVPWCKICLQNTSLVYNLTTNQLCMICQQGFYLDSYNQCSPYPVQLKIPTCNIYACTLCLTNDNCNVCLPYWEVVDGMCVTSFCQVQFCGYCVYTNFCLQCQSGYVLNTTTGACLPVCNISGCSSCSYSNNCNICMNNLVLINNSCTCQPPFILTNNTCTCPTGTTAYNNSCQTCTTQNCQTCSSTNYCYTCMNNFILTSCGCIGNFIYNSTTASCVCSSGMTPYQGSCVTCNVQYCMNCSQANICGVCIGGFVLTTNTCACPDATFSIINNSCICPNGTTLSANTCIACNIPSCQLCSSPNTCSTCFNNLTLQSNTCICPSTFTLVNNTCICPQKTTLSPSTPYTCIQCNITYCQTCGSTNVCQSCMSGFVLGNNACVCPAGFIIMNNMCVCGSQKSLVNGTCINCSVLNCQSCSSANTCSACLNNLILSANNSCTCPATFILSQQTCICPTGTTLSPSSQTCIACNFSNCQQCSQPNVCQTCANNLVLLSAPVCQCPDSSFVVVNGTCVCPTGYTISGGVTCVLCEIQNCGTCGQANVCQICVGNLTLTNNVCGCPDTTFNISNGYCICPAGTIISSTSSTCIACNVTYCQTCSSTNQCQKCINNLSLNNNICGCLNQQTFIPANISCINCTVQNCTQCSTTNFCLQCNAGFVLSQIGTCICPVNTSLTNNQCLSCNIPNCQTCQPANTCTNCTQNSSLNTYLNRCTLCSITNCQYCPYPNYCTFCSNGLVPNSEGNLCISCNVANCSLCENSYTCILCTTGFTLTPNGLCLPCSVQGCLICGSGGLCQVCQLGYYLNNQGICNLCILPCLSCGNTPFFCLTCIYPFSHTAASNGTCYSCNVQNCLSCSVNNSYICINCTKNYILSNNICVLKNNNLCPQSCAICLQNQVCQKCKSGYALNLASQNVCILCNSQNCHTCSFSDTTTCLTCNVGFYNSNGSCFACPYANCQTCDSVSCLTFLPSTGQIAINLGNTINPAMCGFGCRICSSINPESCVICRQGYSLNTIYQTCTACSSPCRSCSFQSPTTCLSCYSNYYLSNNSCLPCTPASNCQTCSPQNASACTSCPNGMYLSNGICFVGCLDNCLSCISDKYCTICMSGYGRNSGGFCLPCVFNCRVCSGDAPGVCLLCGSGFYLNTQGLCGQCTQNCYQCNSNGCLRCQKGYFLTHKQTCQKNCIFPCATCSASGNCTSCLLGFSFNPTNNTCIPSQVCINSSCYTCPIGSSYNQMYACTKCTTNCARCDPFSSCLTCFEGYYMVNTSYANVSCLACSQNCLECSSVSNCFRCMTGYTVALEFMNSQGICVKCQFPCSQCLDSPYRCTSCASGFVMSGWNCQSSFNFGYQIVLNTSIYNFYINYPQFLYVLTSNLLNMTTSPITVTSISPSSPSLSQTPGQLSSVNTTGTISTTQLPGSVTASNQFYSLNNILKSGTIAGMKILSYELVTNGGTLPPEKNTTRLIIIIVAVTVPICLLIICVICCLCRRATKQKSATDLGNKDANNVIELDVTNVGKSLVTNTDRSVGEARL